MWIQRSGGSTLVRTDSSASVLIVVTFAVGNLVDSVRAGDAKTNSRSIVFLQMHILLRPFYIFWSSADSSSEIHCVACNSSSIRLLRNNCTGSWKTISSRFIVWFANSRSNSCSLIQCLDLPWYTIVEWFEKWVHSGGHRARCIGPYRSLHIHPGRLEIRKVRQSVWVGEFWWNSSFIALFRKHFVFSVSILIECNQILKSSANWQR